MSLLIAAIYGLFGYAAATVVLLLFNASAVSTAFDRVSGSRLIALDGEVVADNESECGLPSCI